MLRGVVLVLVVLLTGGRISRGDSSNKFVEVSRRSNRFAHEQKSQVPPDEFHFVISTKPAHVSEITKKEMRSFIFFIIYLKQKVSD